MPCATSCCSRRQWQGVFDRPWRPGFGQDVVGCTTAPRGRLAFRSLLLPVLVEEKRGSAHGEVVVLSIWASGESASKVQTTGTEPRQWPEAQARRVLLEFVQGGATMLCFLVERRGQRGVSPASFQFGPNG